MELDKIAAQDLIRQIFTATVLADTSRAEAWKQVLDIRKALPGGEQISCDGNCDGTVTMYTTDAPRCVCPMRM